MRKAPDSSRMAYNTSTSRGNSASGPIASIALERLAAGGLSAGVYVYFLKPSLSLAEQFLEACLQSLAALVNGDGFLKRHFAFFQALDDRFQLLDRPLEGHFLNIGVVLGHIVARRVFRLQWNEDN